MVRDVKVKQDTNKFERGTRAHIVTNQQEYVRVCLAPPDQTPVPGIDFYLPEKDEAP